MSGNPWTLSINYGPEGEQNYANVYDGHERLVGNLRTHHANTVVTAVNSQAEIERLRDALQMCAMLLPRYRLAGKTTGDDEELAVVLETVTETLSRSKE